MIRGLLFVLLLPGFLCAKTDGIDRASRELIVKWRSLPSRLDQAVLPADVAACTESVRSALPAAERTIVGLERIVVLALAEGADPSVMVEALRADPNVEYAEPRPIRHADEQKNERESLDGVPDDPFYAQQWSLPAIEAEAAWTITRGDPSVVIAVVDVGVDFSHPELAHARWENTAEIAGAGGVDDDGNGFVDDLYGYDFMDLDGNPAPFPLEGMQSHGTHVSGIIAAARNNGQGIAGLAPDCKIMAVRVGQGATIPYGYEGVYYACRAGARIINCSWGGNTESAYERDIVSYALDRGCVIVASAGNDSRPQPHYPAGIEGVLSVAATQIGDRCAQFTNYGPWVKVSAPGVYILSCVIGSGYDYSQGTSFSAPLTAAVCGLVAARFPLMSGRAIMQRVVSSCDPIDAVNPARAGGLGLGRINAWRAVADSVTGVRIVATRYDELSGNGDGRVRAGESAAIWLAVQNDLDTVSNVAATARVLGDGAMLGWSVALFGAVPAGGPRWSTNPLTVSVEAATGRGYVLPLAVDLFGAFGRLIGRAVVRVHLDSSFVNVDNDRLTLGFADNGCLGYRDYLREECVGAGLRISERANALFHGSFVLAVGGSVSDNAYGDATLRRMDWSPTLGSTAHFVESSRADVEAQAVFTDENATNPLFARVQVSALAWREAGANGFIILEYRIANPWQNPWDNVYVGLFLDFDLAAHSLNRAFYDEPSGTAYVSADLPGYPLAGVTRITDEWSSFYVVDNRTEIDTVHWTDAHKWEILTSGIAVPPSDPKDVSVVAGAGPMRIDSHDVRTVAFALVAGESIGDLRTQAAAARSYFGARRVAPGGVSSPRAKAALAPNPLPWGETMRLVLPRGERADVRIYDVLGRIVADYRDVAAGPLDARPPAGASGLLFYRIESPGSRVTGKILVLK